MLRPKEASKGGGSAACASGGRSVEAGSLYFKKSPDNRLLTGTNHHG